MLFKCFFGERVKESLGSLNFHHFSYFFSLPSIHERNRRETEKHIPKEKVKEFQRLLFVVAFDLTSKKSEAKIPRRSAKKKSHCSDRSRSKIHATERLTSQRISLNLESVGSYIIGLCGVFFFSFKTDYLIWLGRIFELRRSFSLHGSFERRSGKGFESETLTLLSLITKELN
jgi:hypothetical protein